MNSALKSWVDEVAALTKPDRVELVDGSDGENRRLIDQMLADGTLHRLNEQRYPNCYLHRSDPSDVARTEHLTFICSQRQQDTGPTNNWMAPRRRQDEARHAVRRLDARAHHVRHSVRHGSARLAVQQGRHRDHRQPVRGRQHAHHDAHGRAALEQLGDSPDFVKGLHSLGDLSPERRLHRALPREKTIWSVGSGYGGNALLGKKCFALRIASVQARERAGSPSTC
jgi:phosphoenolpyruvate carboxykinase (GTP)